ncbi:MAG: cytidylate kinase family protein [Deltaproteobacteria bacterium]|nr:cytidylate kinase family protein [Deltaproteobacteria bacterium]
MSFRVVCISRTLAAGGEDIGHQVAQRLGFRYRSRRPANLDPRGDFRGCRGG